jgi:hypothetical protein
MGSVHVVEVLPLLDLVAVVDDDAVEGAGELLGVDVMERPDCCGSG